MNTDPKAVQSAAVAGLPDHARWTIHDTPLDFYFSDARRCGPRSLTGHDVDGGLPDEWSKFLVFGWYDYAEGGGAAPWIGVRKRDGAVHGLDIEREDGGATFMFNSSIGRFIDSFAALGQYLRNGQPLPPDIAARVRDIDPDAYPMSEWRLLIEHVTDT